MDPKKSRKEKLIIDPIGAEFILSVLGVVIGTISAIHQFGFFPRKDKRIRDEFRSLREQVLRLHNSLDEIILTFERYSHYKDQNIKINIFSRNITISSTTMKLKEKDYIKWLDIRESLFKVSKNVYSIVSKIRALSLEFDINEDIEFLNEVIVSNFDELLSNFGNYNLGDFLGKLRKHLSELDNYLLKIYASHE